MPDATAWIWIFVAFAATIAIIITVGTWVHDRRTPSLEEYRRAQTALQTYEEQQRTYEEQQEQVMQHLARQDALLERIERLVERLERIDWPEGDRHREI